MTEIRYFRTRSEADVFLKELGKYRNPDAVVSMKGSATHEVAVGPVHAGVIEPGHFRFQCMGEDVYNLQIFLGYQHRGVEELIVGAQGNVARQLALAETCAGDSSIAAATCFSEIVEALEAKEPSPETLRERTILLELERIANHVGDLGALAGDVAFLPTASYCGRIRGEFLNMTAQVCGNRFGRNAVAPGISLAPISSEKAKAVLDWIDRVRPNLLDALTLMFNEPSVCDRLEGTGVVSKEDALALGLVGVAARACREGKGDVLSRALVRRTEINEAFDVIIPALGDIVAGKGAARRDATVVAWEPSPFAVVLSKVNAWRGELVHAAFVNDERKFLDYAIVDPSAHNWPGLALALRGEQISNFPICNKSFNLSYCGTDR